MQYLRARLLRFLVAHFGEDERRIDHALRVTSWAEKILEWEPGDEDVVLAVAALHDIGIKEAEARHGRSDGKLQEQYGPPIAREALESIGLAPAKIDEACAIIGCHHTPKGVDSQNFRILWDADLLVNIPEDSPGLPKDKLEFIIEKSLQTTAGKALARRTWLNA